MSHILKTTLLLALLCAFFCASGQVQKDTTIDSARKNNIFNYAMRFIEKNKKDTIDQKGVLATRSEIAYKQYEGKIIRHIIISRYKFEKSFSDTSKSIKYFGTKILNALHNNTKPWVIKNNLYIKENTPVSAVLLADNERFLRTLPYIQDARIIIQPKTGSDDSVDVYVFTKDLFTINGDLHNASTNRFRASIEDANLFAVGQKLHFDLSVEEKRSPSTGFGIFYTKYNIAHTFIDASAGYTTVNPNLKYKTTDERAVTFSLQRNLVSQYKHAAGGLTWGDFRTYNKYKLPVESFYNYHYRLFDGWVGYKLGVKNYIHDKSNLNRKFVSLRYYQTKFYERPQQVDSQLYFRFDDKKAVLGQLTLFKQEFYKTNYLYGFGTTEDIPFGYNISFTAGWFKQSYLSRPYFGIDANRYVVYNKGDIIQYFLRTGVFIHKGSLQDAGILAGISGFSRAFVLKNFKLRQYFRLSYTGIYNRTGLEPLTINNPFGLRNFTRDSVMGEERLSLHSETIGFIRYKVFGFKFSPFLAGDITSISPRIDNPGQHTWFFGLGGGFRMRNENLIFNTVEVRCAYFPNTAYGMKHFYASVSTNISFRYNSNYVREPDIIQYNSDLANNIY